MEDFSKGMIKVLIDRIKELQKTLPKKIDDRSHFGGFEDCGDFYIAEVDETKAIISELISIKIKLEKFRKANKTTQH